MKTPDYSRRVAGVRAALDGHEIDALLVTELVNVRYLTGYAGSNGLVLVGGDGATFMTDFRYLTAAEPIAEFMSVRMLAGETSRFLGEHIAEMAPGATRIGFEGAHVSVALYEKLVAAFGPELELVATADIVEDAAAGQRRLGARGDPPFGRVDRPGVRGDRRRGIERQA